jgi:hypothetical protein
MLKSITPLIEQKLHPLKKNILKETFTPQAHSEVNGEKIKGTPTVNKLLDLVFPEEFWDPLHEGIVENLDKVSLKSNHKYHNRKISVDVKNQNSFLGYQICYCCPFIHRRGGKTIWN